MAKKPKTIVNCKCLKEKKFKGLTQGDDCVCNIGTSMSSSKRVLVKRVNLTIVKEFSAFD